MSLKRRIREELDKGSGYNIDQVVNTIAEQGLSLDEIKEALTDIVRHVAKTRSVGAFFSEEEDVEINRVDKELLPKQKFVKSSKVQGYQNKRLDEVYPTETGYKRLSEMSRADVQYNVRLLENQIRALNGRLKGWDLILDKMDKYEVDCINDLPDEVKREI